ncbi:MAG: STAS domain-containing protein [Lautropia sp.]|nr:STAS domain-containing protein [Lautropia sp.]
MRDRVDGPSLVVPARIDSSNVADVLARMTEAGRQHVRDQGASCCQIDLAGLEHFDSTVLSMLLELGRQVGKPLAVINPPAKLRELAILYGVAELLLGEAPAQPSGQRGGE